MPKQHKNYQNGDDKKTSSLVVSFMWYATYLLQVIEKALREWWPGFQKVREANDPAAGLDECTLGVVESIIASIQEAIQAMGGKVEIRSVEDGVVQLAFEGNPKLQQSIRWTYLNNPLIQEVNFIDFWTSRIAGFLYLAFLVCCGGTLCRWIAFRNAARRDAVMNMVWYASRRYATSRSYFHFVIISITYVVFGNSKEVQWDVTLVL